MELVIFLEPAPQLLEPRYPEKHRVRAGFDGQFPAKMKGLTTKVMVFKAFLFP
jgi:hypothetical protein